MAEDGDKAARSGEIVAREEAAEIRKHERRLNRIDRESQAQRGVIQEIGSQLNSLAQAPGVKVLLESFGAAMVAGRQLEAKRVEDDGELKLQHDQNQADIVKQRNKYGLITVLVGAPLVVIVTGVAIYLIDKGVISPETTKNAGTVIALILGAFGIGRGTKKKPDEK